MEFLHAIGGGAVLADSHLPLLSGGVFSLLLLASLATYAIHAAYGSTPTISNLVSRMKAWWAMITVFFCALVLGPHSLNLLFVGVSYQALTEYLDLTPEGRSGDKEKKARHSTLALRVAFYLVLPLQYLLIAVGWYGFFAVFIPVYAFVFIPLAMAAQGDLQHFLVRTAEVQWGLMLCVYCPSHVPALLMFHVKGYQAQEWKLLLFVILVGQASDVLQYVWGKTLGRTKLAPVLSPSKTWEGLVGGLLSASALGAALHGMTPFPPWQAALFSLQITLLGFGGGLVMSALKRDKGIKDFGTLLEVRCQWQRGAQGQRQYPEGQRPSQCPAHTRPLTTYPSHQGHGGVMDRIDSLCFSAPVFFHLVKWYYSPSTAPL